MNGEVILPPQENSNQIVNEPDNKIFDTNLKKNSEDYIKSGQDNEDGEEKRKQEEMKRRE